MRGHHIPEGLGATVPFGVAVHAKVSTLYSMPLVMLSDKVADSVTAAFSICCVVPSLTCTALTMYMQTQDRVVSVNENTRHLKNGYD